MVAAGAALLVEQPDGLLQVVEGVVVVEAAGTNRKPSASRSQTVFRNGVRAYCLTASCTTCPKSSVVQSRRANPTSAKPGGSSPRLARS